MQCAISNCCLHVCWRMFVCVHLFIHSSCTKIYKIKL
uniref:Uncharacterized protein n=1 Tax=Anguilla anguilla TaxID=7936 RepID=A0A0E9VJT2_ANGAN